MNANAFCSRSSTIMSARVLVLGAAGRLGHAAARAFRDAGWSVASLVRPGSAARAPADTEVVEVHALDHAAVGAAARAADVVLHALTAAETAGATLLFAGNLYNYGSPLPLVIDENTPMRPSSRKGQLRVAIEERLAEAAERGVRIIILRSGDFYGLGRGSWLDLVLAKEIGRGRLTYPGPLDVVHEWAYLPDVAATLPRLAAIRETLPPFGSLGFPGHAVTGREFTGAIAAATRSKLQVDRMTWWLIHALRPVVPLCRELSEIAYLWDEPHRIDGGKLEAAIGDIPRTPLDVAATRALEDLGAIA
jgi:nucleoside-diphosphate-sugar epimerase